MDSGTPMAFLSIAVVLAVVVIAAVVGGIWYFVSGSGDNKDE